MRRRYGFLKLRSYDDDHYRLVHPQRISRSVRYENLQQLSDLEEEMRQSHVGQEGFWLEGPVACEYPILYDNTTIYGVFPRLTFIEPPGGATSPALVRGIWVDAPRASLPERLRSWGYYLVAKDS